MMTTLWLHFDVDPDLDLSGSRLRYGFHVVRIWNWGGLHYGFTDIICVERIKRLSHGMIG